MAFKTISGSKTHPFFLHLLEIGQLAIQVMYQPSTIALRYAHCLVSRIGIFKSHACEIIRLVNKLKIKFSHYIWRGKGAYALRGMGRTSINEVPEEWSMHSDTHTHALHCLQISRSALHHLHAALQPFVLNSGFCQFQRHTTTEPA